MSVVVVLLYQVSIVNVSVVAVVLYHVSMVNVSGCVVVAVYHVSIVNVSADVVVVYQVLIYFRGSLNLDFQIKSGSDPFSQYGSRFEFFRNTAPDSEQEHPDPAGSENMFSKSYF